uniref:RNA-dependent RNA polymerase n=1 Tax=Elemess virus TaxID=2800913 RepID=A0A894KLK0_9VIRU|nr:MAG: RNA-dependent RNA polymerase [Elemess virus]
MNASILSDLETIVHSARTNRYKLFEYLTGKTSKLKVDSEGMGACDVESSVAGASFRSTRYSVQGLTSFGHSLQFDILVPPEIVQPPKFVRMMYPLADNETGFEHERPSNYLCNFDWYDFIHDEHIDYPERFIPAIRELIDNSAQTRFSNIWVNVFSIHLYLNMNNIGSQLVQLMYWILNGWEEFPFRDVGDTFQDVLPNTSTMWPLLIYKYLSVCFDFICGNVSEIEALMAFQIGLNQAKEHYQDVKLKQKSHYVTWTKILLDKIGTATVPRYIASGLFRGQYTASTSEIFDPDEKQKRIRDMRENVDPLFMQYYNASVNEIHTIEDIIRLDTIARCARDDRTYYGTLIELAAKDAIEPHVYGPGVPAPIPLLTDRYDTSMMYDAEYPKDHFISKIQEFAELYIDLLSEKVNMRDADNQFINFLSTSSAGLKIPMPDEILRRIHDEKFKRLLIKIGGKRVVQAALTINLANDMNHFVEMTIALTVAIIRKQIERRQRSIASINNTALENSHPTYIANKSFSSIHRAPAHGKQSGNSSDLHNLLFVTTTKGTVCSSQDVKGMDTSIQLNVARNQQILAMRVLDGKSFDTGPFTTVTKECVNRDGVIIMKTLNGAQQRIAAAEKLGTKVTVIRSKYFGDMPNQEGTFTSGLLTTSNHHTQFLVLAIEAAALEWSKEHAVAIGITEMMVLGDDIFLSFASPIPVVRQFMDFLVNKFLQIGLSLEKDESTNMATFLQQQVIKGRFNGFANRISPFAREDHKVRKSVPESCSEMQALFDDLVARVYDPHSMLRFHRLFAFVTLSKHVMLVPSDKYDKLKSIVSSRLKVYEYDMNDKKEHQDLRFFGLQIPYLYFFLHGGGSIPPESFQRLDMTYTKEYGVLSPRGEVLRRFLFDLSNSKVLDQEILALYNIHVAYFFIDTKWLSLSEQIRSDSIDYDIVNSLARNLESIEKGDSREISRRAFANLASLGVDLPRSTVYGYQINERIKTVLQAVEESTSEVLMVSDAQVSLLMTKFLNYRVKSLSNDLHHAFTMTPVKNDRLFVHTPEFYALRNIALTKSMFPGSPIYNLYIKQDHTTNVTGLLATALAHSQGHYKNFRYDRQAFQESLGLAHKYGLGSNVLNLFFEAIHASEQVRQVWRDAIRYYMQFGEFVYPYSTNPRRMFYIDERPASILNLVDPKSLPKSVHARALAIRQSYVYLTSHLEVLEDYSYFILCQRE